MLVIGSPVFEAMFYGELAETKDTIELPGYMTVIMRVCRSCFVTCTAMK